jgi:sugar (pentulose or hexulose) kinase
MDLDAAPVDPIAIAVELGTHAARAAIVGPAAQLLDVTEVRLDSHTPAAGRVEQDPEQWWAATIDCLQELVSRNHTTRVDALAVGAQLHAVVPIDQDGRCLVRRVGLWNDERAAGLAAGLAARPDARRLTRLAGNRPDPVRAGIKVAWYRQRNPTVYDAAWQFLAAKDFLNYRLTGVAATDPTEASGSFCMDAESGKWSDELIAALGINGSKLPPIIGSTEICGRLRPEVAGATGLPVGLPVVGGAGDLLCQAAAAGLHHAERAVEISQPDNTIAATYSDLPHPAPTVMSLRAAGTGWIQLRWRPTPDSRERGCFEVRRMLDVLGRARLRSVRVVGTNPVDPVWNQLRAAVYGLPVVTLRATEGRLIGAGLLALVGAGAYVSVGAAADAVGTEASRTFPDPERAEAYDGAYARYLRSPSALG